MNDSSRLNWPVFLFVTLSPLVALGGVTWWIASGRANLETLLLAASMAIATGLGITGGYHRLFSHRSYEAAWPVRLVLLLLGGAAVEESAVQWCRDHRRHHRYIDRDGDPYDIRKGFWHAHLFWMLRKEGRKEGERWPADLWQDPLVRFQHRFYVPIVALVSFLLPLGIASFWGDPWGGLIVAGFARVVVNQHLTFVINSVCHSIGRQPYSDRHSARDHWLSAVLTYGEGYHNFHHEFPVDYRNGHRFYHWDPTKWLIYVLSRMRIASNLRIVSPEVIARKRISMQDRILAERLRFVAGENISSAVPRVEAARKRIQVAFAKIRVLRQQCRSGADGNRIFGLHAKEQLREAQLEFKQAVAGWEALRASI